MSFLCLAKGAQGNDCKELQRVCLWIPFAVTMELNLLFCQSRAGPQCADDIRCHGRPVELAPQGLIYAGGTRVTDQTWILREVQKA